ncbi:copper resistance protein CopC [Agromyces intestinalis]|uniref:Copper resistance protein CopC n=1 Tax=Agromyces intestinalis TaxID=2592652 RepID=A0A5C1YG59_9MICO|nr:copper resistance CopC family protein [Agromyces intestinalis]QEO15023.1 copper resistance protein CopC [Agromyces intestinalis]
MSARVKLRRAAGFAAAGAAVCTAALLAVVPAAPAAAHNSITSTSPAEGATVTAQPGEVSLTTSDELLDLGSGNVIDVVGPDGLHYATACATIAGSDASVPVALGGAGEYTVEWRVVSADGHPIAGEFAFEWAPAEGEVLADGAAEPACTELVTSGEATDVPADSDGGSPALPADALWIGAAAVLVIAAGVATWLVARPRRTPPAE